MLKEVNSDIFLKSKSISLKPMVFAEWNQNLYGSPYTTVAGTGVKETGLTEVSTLIDASESESRSNFVTKKFNMTADGQAIEYAIALSGNSAAYKIVTFIKTTQAESIMANVFVKGGESQFGSSSVQINSVGWTKVETYVGGSHKEDYVTGLSYNIALNRLSTEDSIPDIIFTEPEVYPISFFNYQYNSLWPTSEPFKNFRPGESYVNTGSSLFSFPEDYRKVVTPILNGYTEDTYMPTTPIIHNPSFYNVSAPVPFYKDNMVNSMCNYKYFVSDTENTSVTALYEGSGIILNKLVLKFNTLVAVPTINIAINGTNISVDGSESISLSLNINKEDGGIREDAGVLVLYYNGQTWTRNRWTDMPVIGADGNITKIMSASRITITQTNNTKRSGFSSLSPYLADDILRMQLIEASPRVEVDITPFLIDLSINKSMDNKSTLLPISSINANDATISLSSIPLGTTTSPIPIFSNQSNSENTVLKNMLRKNIKFYTFFYLDGYHDQTNSKFIDSNQLIPAGIFYSDTWSETDINQVAVQGYDITRYLQSVQVSDYVCNLKSVIDIITNILDLSGFTDYDYDSLSDACLNKNTPLDLAYYYVNSKDTTLVDALNQICLPYQIACYIDEYGILKFLSLGKIVDPKYIDPDLNPDIINVDGSVVNDSGYAIVNKGKPGKISVRYQLPKIKQSETVQNLDPEIVAGPSFILISGNEIVWSQQNVDSVGLNYLNDDMNEFQNYFQLDVNDVLDIFHTYSRDASGYAAIENEIVSFEYKEYSIKDPTSPEVFVRVKSNTELEAEKSRYIKKYNTGLKIGNGLEKPEEATTVQHGGKIVNVERGLFGSKVSAHTVLSSTTNNDKDINNKILSSSYTITGNSTLHSTTATNHEFIAIAPSTGKAIFYPKTERSTVITDSGLEPYKTYSTKFHLLDNNDKCSGGLFFNMPNTETNAEGAYFVELVKYNTYSVDGVTKNNPPIFGYAMVVYKVVSGAASIIAYSDITSIVKTIIDNFEKVLEKQPPGSDPLYIPKTDPRYASFNLRVSTYESTGEDGENASPTNLLLVFLNNVEVTGWKVPSGASWVPIELNESTARPKKIQYSTPISADTIFGSFVSANPIQVPGVTYPSVTQSIVGGVREIYATHKALIERRVNYYFQDREFLNGMVQELNLFSKSKSYIMQTKPEVIGINTYDVQYTTPAAVNVDIQPVSYLLKYAPSGTVADMNYLQNKEVSEDSLSYSTILNTGFRGKFAIANNASHMVFLKFDATDQVMAHVWLNLYTTEIIATSDPEILEQVIDPGNASETIQIDSKWIQSKTAALKLLSTISNSVDNFSKDLSLSIFGNPLIQVGDIISLTYPLMGINQQKYFVTSVSHDFTEGLATKLGLNMLSKGIDY